MKEANGVACACARPPASLARQPTYPPGCLAGYWLTKRLVRQARRQGGKEAYHICLRPAAIDGGRQAAVTTALSRPPRSPHTSRYCMYICGGLAEKTSVCWCFSMKRGTACPPAGRPAGRPAASHSQSTARAIQCAGVDEFSNEFIEEFRSVESCADTNSSVQSSSFNSHRYRQAHDGTFVSGGIGDGDRGSTGRGSGSGG